MRDDFIRPKDKLSQVFWLRYHFRYSKAQAVEYLTRVHSLKTWFMAGNHLTIEKCVLKCERWSKRFNISWKTAEDGGWFEMKMPHVDFKYSWVEHRAYISITSKAAEALHLYDCDSIVDDRHIYILKGKYCCDIEKVFTLNERLEYALELPLVLDFYERNGQYEAKYEEFKALARQLDWWTHTIEEYSWFNVRIASPIKIAKRLPIDNETQAEAHVYWEDCEIFTFKSAESRTLDEIYASRFIPKFQKLADYYEQCAEYTKDYHFQPCIKQYPLDKKEIPFSFYEDVKDLKPEYMFAYNAIYEVALHLEYDGPYRYHLCSMQMTLPCKWSNGRLEFYFNTISDHSCQCDTLKCLPNELQEKFPPFLEAFMKRTHECAKDRFAYAKQKIWFIENALNKNIEK